jgi:hypothetical protein
MTGTANVKPMPILTSVFAKGWRWAAIFATAEVATALKKTPTY